MTKGAQRWHLLGRSMPTLVVTVAVTVVVKCTQTQGVYKKSVGIPDDDDLKKTDNEDNE